MTAESAHKILDIFAHFGGQPGHILLANHFLAVGGRRGWSAAELQDGLEDAHRRGWLEPADRGWQLTREGFDEASKMLHA